MKVVKNNGELGICETFTPFCNNSGIVHIQFSPFSYFLILNIRREFDFKTFRHDFYYDINSAASHLSFINDPPPPSPEIILVNNRTIIIVSYGKI